MEKVFKIILIICIILFTGIIVYIQKDFIVSDFNSNSINNSTMKGVVVKVYENELGVLGKNGDNDLYLVDFGKEKNIGFKQGQEIEIYYNGFVMEMFPARPSGVSNIKIIKEKSDKQIPEFAIEFFNNSTDKNRFFYNPTNENNLIEMNIKDGTLTPKGATFILKNNTDKEYSYEPAYYLEKKENGNWKKIELDEPLSWNSVIFTLKSREEIEINIDWLNTGYGVLNKGQYRLSKTNFRENYSSSSVGFEIHAEFEIK